MGGGKREGGGDCFLLSLLRSPLSLSLSRVFSVLFSLSPLLSVCLKIHLIKNVIVLIKKLKTNMIFNVCMQVYFHVIMI